MNCNLFEIMIAFLGVLIAFMQLKLLKKQILRKKVMRITTDLYGFMI